MAAVRDINVLLIGGAGRTGTNVLKDVLANHPDVFALPFESRFTVDPDGVACTLKSLKYTWSPFIGEKCFERHVALLGRMGRRSLPDRISMVACAVLKRCNITAQFRSYSEWQLESYFPGYRECVAELKKNLTFIDYHGIWPGSRPHLRSSYQAIAKSDLNKEATDAFQKFLFGLYSKVLEHHGKSVYVDDNTFNSIYADELLNILPGARLVNVVRDPRDATSSYLRQRWVPDDIVQAAQYHKEVVNTWRNLRDTMDFQSYLEIRLEDLASEPETTLRKVCQFAKIPFSSRLLLTPLNRANSGRWIADIDERWHSWINDTFSEILGEYGYI